MTGQVGKLINRLVHRRFLRRWGREIDCAGSADLAELRTMRTRAREIRRRMDQELHRADARRTWTVIGTNGIQTPLQADW